MRTVDWSGSLQLPVYSPAGDEEPKRQPGTATTRKRKKISGIPEKIPSLPPVSWWPGRLPLSEAARAGGSSACMSHKRSPTACEMAPATSLGLGFLALLAVCRHTTSGETCAPPCIQAHSLRLGYEL